MAVTLPPHKNPRSTMDIDLGCAEIGLRGQVLAGQIVFFDRPDLRIGVSGAKFHEEIDFDA